MKPYGEMILNGTIKSTQIDFVHWAVIAALRARLPLKGEDLSYEGKFECRQRKD